MASLDVDNIATKVATKNTTTKSNKRKRKFEIKKVEEPNKLHLTFLKRKQGLFNKVTELSLLCEAKTALIVSSPNGDFYACGYPTPDTVTQRFLNPFSRKKEKEKKVEIEDIKVKYEEIQDQLKEEKKKLQVLTEEHKSSSSSFPSWWNLSIENMNLECLEEFKNSLERLKLNLVTTMEVKRFSSLESLPLDVSSPPPSSNHSLLNDYDGLQPLAPLAVFSPQPLSNYSLMSDQSFYDQQENYDVACPSFMAPPTTTTTLSNYSLLNECFLDQQENYNVDAASPSFMVPDGFGHYY